MVTDGRGLFEPSLRIIEPSKLGAIAGEIVRHHPVFGKPAHHSTEQIMSCLRVFEPIEGHRLVYPTAHPVGSTPGHHLGNLQGAFPLIGACTDLPPQFQHIGVAAQTGCNALQFLLGLPMIAQLDPTLGG